MIKDPVCNRKFDMNGRCSRGGHRAGIGGLISAQTRGRSRFIGNGLRPVCNARREV
jgi:hypothetical protein